MHKKPQRRRWLVTDSRRGKYSTLSNTKVLIRSHSSPLSTHCFSLPYSCLKKRRRISFFFIEIRNQWGGGSKSRRGKFSQFFTACITAVLIRLLLFYSSNSLFKSPVLFLSSVCEVRRVYFISDRRGENKESQQLPHQRALMLVASAVIRFYRLFKYGSDGTLSFKCQRRKTRLFYKRGARRE